MVEDLDGIQRLGGFNHNQIREFLQGFLYKIMYEIGRDRRGMRRGVD